MIQLRSSDRCPVIKSLNGCEGENPNPSPLVAMATIYLFPELMQLFLL